MIAFHSSWESWLSEWEMYSEIMALVLDFLLKNALDSDESASLCNPNHCVSLPSDIARMQILHALFLANQSLLMKRLQVVAIFTSSPGLADHCNFGCFVFDLFFLLILAFCLSDTMFSLLNQQQLYSSKPWENQLLKLRRGNTTKVIQTKSSVLYFRNANLR